MRDLWMLIRDVPRLTEARLVRYLRWLGRGPCRSGEFHRGPCEVVSDDGPSYWACRSCGQTHLSPVDWWYDPELYGALHGHRVPAPAPPPAEPR